MNIPDPILTAERDRVADLLTNHQRRLTAAERNQLIGRLQALNWMILKWPTLAKARTKRRRVVKLKVVGAAA